MSHENRLRIKTLSMVLLMVVVCRSRRPAAEEGHAAGWRSARHPRGLAQAFVSTLAISRPYGSAILFLIGFTLCYMTVVSWADYSYVMPAGAFGYAVQTALAVVILHEMVTPKRWIGVALICIGVLLVGQTTQYDRRRRESRRGGVMIKIVLMLAFFIAVGPVAKSR